MRPYIVKTKDIFITLFIIVDKARSRVEDVLRVWWGRINTRHDTLSEPSSLGSRYPISVHSTESKTVTMMRCGLQMELLGTV